MPTPSSQLKALRTYALSLPETREEFPWGDRVVKVRKKIFVFLGEEADPDARIGLKLGVSHDAALALPGAAPMGYGMGKSGWVVVPFRTSQLDQATWREWIAESYALIA